MRLLPLLLLLSCLLHPASPHGTSHLHGLPTWKLVEAVISAYNGDWEHSRSTLRLSSARCEELYYTRKLLNIEQGQGCTSGRVNRVIHRWLNGNRRNWNTQLRVLIDEYAIGDLLFSADVLYQTPLIQELGVSEVSAFWDTWPSKHCYDMVASRLEKFLLDLQNAKVPPGNKEETLAHESLLLTVEMSIKEYRRWYVHKNDIVPMVAAYVRKMCDVQIVDDIVARGWIRRLQTFGDKVRDFEDFFSRGRGKHGPHYLLANVLNTLQRTLALVREGRLVGCFWHSYVQNQGSDPPHAMLVDATLAINSTVVPALERFVGVLGEALRTEPDSGPGVWGSVNGTEYYKYQILYHTTLELTPEELHQVGVAEIARIKAEIRNVVRQIYSTGDKLLSPTWTMQRIFSTIRHHDAFFYDTTDKEGIVASVRRILTTINQKMDKAFTRDIMTAGEAGMNIVTDRQGSMGWYTVSEGLGNNGTFHIGTGSTLSKLKMRALVCHEAVPGHHYQFSLLHAYPMLSKLSAARVEYSVSTEGWSLYAEVLCGEMGIMDAKSPDLPPSYSTLYYQLGRLSMRLVRATRLVIDTGLHAKGWSRDRAVGYFSRHTDVREDLIQSEVDRYITYPGQALSYHVGLSEVMKLREEVARKMGESFDIREFHRIILSAGSVPLPILRRYVADMF